MREASIEKACRARATLRGVPSFKLTSYIAGDPDRAFLLPAGLLWLVEFKTPGGVLSPRQKIRHAQLAVWGHPVTVITSTAQFQEMLDMKLRATT